MALIQAKMAQARPCSRSAVDRGCTTYVLEIAALQDLLRPELTLTYPDHEQG